MTELSRINSEIARKFEKDMRELESRIASALSAVGQNHVAVLMGYSESHVSKNRADWTSDAAKLLAAIGAAIVTPNERVVPADDLAVLATLSEHGYERLKEMYKPK